MGRTILPERAEMAELADLAAALSALEGRAGLDTVWSVLPDARLVGGVVRDLLGRRPLADLDLATPEPPDIVLKRLREAGVKVVPTGIAHGTLTAVIGGRPYEITTLRRDVKTDGRHAIVAWTGDWAEDAARRDFTINAMSLDRAGALHDYFEGAADLAAGRVRFVGEARQRIEEDALRILRFFRFQARYGNGEPDDAALAAIAGTSALLDGLSAERIWSELRRLLAGSDGSGGEGPIASIRLMHRLGILDRLLPGGADPDRLERLVSLDAPADPVLRLAALLRGPASPVAARLRLANAEAARLADLQHDEPVDPEADDDALRRRLADAGPARMRDRSWLTQASLSPANPDGWRDLRQRLDTMIRPVFPLAGRDALAAGVPPGPAVGEAMRRVGDWWREGGCRADRDACLAQLLRVLSISPPGSPGPSGG